MSPRKVSEETSSAAYEEAKPPLTLGQRADEPMSPKSISDETGQAAPATPPAKKREEAAPITGIRRILSRDDNEE